ncbi:Sugar ABC transporter permease OS=Streptomyces tendae OX=1932 GN=GUR47_13075 PE=3 SV=1 [Streptomyces tendae]
MTATTTAPGRTQHARHRPPAVQPAARLGHPCPLLPALVFMVVVTQLPFVATLVISFFDWNALYPDARHFTGFANYGDVLGDPARASRCGRRSAHRGGRAGQPGRLALALLLDRRFKGRGVVRTLLIAPFLVVPVAAALLWNTSSTTPNTACSTACCTTSADPARLDLQHPAAGGRGLTGVAVDAVHDAHPAGRAAEPGPAADRGRPGGRRGRRQIFVHLTLPHLRRYLELGPLGSIYIVQNFDAVFTITSGGLGTANLPYTVYQFNQAHENGLASAAGVLVVIGSIIIATFALRVVSSLFREEVGRA